VTHGAAVVLLVSCAQDASDIVTNVLRFVLDAFLECFEGCTVRSCRSKEAKICRGASKAQESLRKLRGQAGVPLDLELTTSGPNSLAGLLFRSKRVDDLFFDERA